MIESNLGTTLFSIGLVGLTIILYIKKRNDCLSENRKLLENDHDFDRAINEVLFFPDCEFPCPAVVDQLSIYPEERRVNCYNKSCRRLHGRTHESPSSLLKFMTYLSQARHKVDICIYVFTQFSIAKILENLVKSGVRVRVITDGAEDDASGNQLHKLRSCGIIVKSNERHTGALMHHKFVIIDDKMLLAGSFNWTNKAVVSNYEAVLVTTQSTLVVPFVSQFEQMWSTFNVHPISKNDP